MNSTSFAFATQSLLNSSNISSLPPQVLFKFNTNHINISHISTPPRKLTTKASASSVASLISAPKKETLYDLLGISENFTLSHIKHAYKRMALKYHPDVPPPDRVDEYTEKFIRVQEAYETLSDPEARFMYDSCMANGSPFRVREKPGLTQDPMIRTDGRRRGWGKYRSSSREAPGAPTRDVVGCPDPEAMERIMC